MNKALRNWAAALIAAVAAPIIAAGAQQEDFGRRWPQEAPAPVPQIPPRAAQQNPPAAEPGTNPPPAARPSVPRPDIAGTWSGTVTQVGGESKYTVVLTLTGNAGQTDYPELNCGGKLTRIGASKDYVFYVEVITRGQAEKGGRCPDGTITVARAGDKLNWVWFGVPRGDVIIAFGTLTRKTAR